MIEIKFNSSIGMYEAGKTYKVDKGRANYYIRVGKAVLIGDADCGCVAPKAPEKVVPVVVKPAGPTAKKATKKASTKK